MKEPRARAIHSEAEHKREPRTPRAFESTRAAASDYDFAAEAAAGLDRTGVTPEPPRRSRVWRRLALFTGGTLVAAGLTLAADRLIADLFARHEWLGWAGLAVFVVFVVAVVALIIREVVGLMRLRSLDRLREGSAAAYALDDAKSARAIASELLGLYAHRADLARAREHLEQDARNVLDGAELIKSAERGMLVPLDARAKALTAESARRVALVTAVSPRAAIDIAFVIFESFRLTRNLADLYGARPGLFGLMRVIRAILAHLAVTGGLVLTDGVVEQLVGQGLATKLSARLGEGVVNGLMTVRVGVAAMRVVRPMPFMAQKSPVVSDFIGELMNTASEHAKK